jgi:AraC-like DNA-binding protein
MRLAANLLADPTRGSRQVAAKAGYASATSFSSAFKRWAGHAPSECRTGLSGKARLREPSVKPVGPEVTDRYY